MSGVSSSLGGIREWVRELRSELGWLQSPRTLALAGAAGLVFSFLRPIHEAVGVTGGRTTFLLLAGASVLGAVIVARALRVKTVAAVAGALFVGGLVLYLLALPDEPSLGPLLASNVELLSGRTILHIKQTSLWAFAVTPAPTFLTLYLALRRWYTTAAGVGGVMLGYFVLTTDAGTTVTLLGVVSATAMIGFGDIDYSTDSSDAVQAITVVLAVMVVAPFVLPAVPAGGADPLSLTGQEPDSVEASLLSTDSQLEVVGSISLSPKVRFTVESPVGTYWKVGSYDRYTGNGWIRTGTTRPYPGRVGYPPGPTRVISQTVYLDAEMSVMPAAWRPISVGTSVAPVTQVTSTGDLRPSKPFEDGDVYVVTSALPTAGPRRLATAGTDYPDRIVRRYTQLPADTPNRVTERTARLTRRADTPYETARIVETWLENNKEYSLDVEEPAGNVADTFLFEMEKGYCTYFATTMVVMLRTQGIPARLAVGYTPGEQSGANRWVVRGYDAHVWVEVYFPDIGWVRFDPTPAGPRRAAEQDRLSRARANDAEDIRPDRTPRRNRSETTRDRQTANGTAPEVTVNVNVDLAPETPTSVQNETTTSGFEFPDPPSREELALGFVVVAGAVAGLRRTGLTRRLSLWARSRLDGRDDPETRIERAFTRLELHLERAHRVRHDGETVRAYLDDIGAGERARRVAEIRERAQYRGDATEEMAAEAERHLTDLPSETATDGASSER